VPESSDVPWFAGEAGEFFLFRVNRRPLDDLTLFTRAMPRDVFEHFERMLAPGYEVVTGRRHQRTWRVGGVQRHDEDRTLTGRLGWIPRGGEEIVPEWSDEEKDWLSAMATTRGGRIVPFGFDGETRLLTVLSDRSSQPSTVAAVFEHVLRDNERALLPDERSTEWSVEPILDAHEFLEWLDSLDVVNSVSFTARLPNPEPRDAFRDLVERMEARRATEYTETLKSDRDEGLQGVQDDRDVQQAVVMGEHGFARLRGRGQRGGRESRFTQSREVASDHVDELPATWQEVRNLTRAWLKGQLRRFLDDTPS
jgi:hypothetical protein